MKNEKILNAMGKISDELIEDAVIDTREKPRTAVWVKWTAVAAACVLLLMPITAYAIENLFGISVVEIVKGNTSTGKLGTGFEVSYPDLTSRQLSDFPEDIQNMDGNTQAVYDSWQQAEEALGITLVNNTFLSSENVAKQHAYNLEAEGLGKGIHCFASFHGKDNQFYRATIMAAYRYDNMHITVRSTVTCDHPAISEEEEYRLHWHGVMYENDAVDDILQEQYVAANGINATIITVKRTESKTTDYEACFAANGASYRITIHAYDQERNAEAKENIIKIVESFIF